MRRFSGEAVNFVAGLALLFALPQAAHAIGMIRISDPSICVDGMETDPDDGDDMEPVLVTVDGGCMIQQQQDIVLV